MTQKRWATASMRWAAITTAAAATFLTVFAPTAHAETWTVSNSNTQSSFAANAGVATYPNGTVSLRGSNNISGAMQSEGWDHLGDHDITPNGEIVDSWERSDRTSKMFTITRAGGRVDRYPHPLASGEKFNNSFVTVSPDFKYLVSGEWDTVTRLLVFAHPGAAPSNTALPLIGTIELSPPLYRIQGCDFRTATQLLCTTDDANNSIAAIDMTRPVQAGTNSATTRPVFVPRRVSACGSSGFESEGIDYNTITKALTAAIISPGFCATTTTINTYTSTP